MENSVLRFLTALDMHAFSYQNSSLISSITMVSDTYLDLNSRMKRLKIILFRMMSGAQYNVSLLQALESERRIKLANKLNLFTRHHFERTSLQTFFRNLLYN